MIQKAWIILSLVPLFIGLVDLLNFCPSRVVLWYFITIHIPDSDRIVRSLLHWEGYLKSVPLVYPFEFVLLAHSTVGVDCERRANSSAVRSPACLKVEQIE